MTQHPWGEIPKVSKHRREAFAPGLGGGKHDHRVRPTLKDLDEVGDGLVLGVAVHLQGVSVNVAVERPRGVEHPLMPK